ncbi:MAG: T9SS-dependent M36 family metallopeptidase [Saprospiraceae bacterium]
MLLCLPFTGFGQLQSKLDIALRYVEQHREQWKLTSADIADMVVSDNYQTRHNGATHIYFIQRHASIPVYNAIMGVHLASDGKVVFSTSRFTRDLAASVNTTAPAISAYHAVEAAARNAGLSIGEPLRLVSQNGDRSFVFDKGNIAKSDIKVDLMYYSHPMTGTVRLAWSLTLDQIDTPDYWSMRVDAVTGEILHRQNLTVYCSFGDKTDECHVHDDHCQTEEAAVSGFKPVQEALAEARTLLTDATYHVFPIPVESPIHGDRELVMNPQDLVASPHGWHDINNAPGPEFRITRGNNVHAYQDSGNENTSVNDEPDGGDPLVFDFPFDPGMAPETYREAAITQLFYMNNIMHDVTYQYGFDEAAGNFQRNNYGNGGTANDDVKAEGQDGGGTNNANFATPADGGSGRMQMYLWNSAGGKLLTVLAPEQIAGAYETGTAAFGPEVSSTPIIGEVVQAFDGSNQPHLGCGAYVNAADVAGKVALVIRGQCFFEEKAARAEAAGAIALIICNFEESAIGMAGVATVPDPTIPTVMIKNSDCQTIINFLNDGVTVKLQTPDTTGTSTEVDGDFDNGVMAHEYGHGISNRLTGGPAQAGCLSSDEQMGEGWSDFFSLIMQAKPGDEGTFKRGIGNFVTRNDPDGGGIRRLPYSTDPQINSQNYDDVIGTTSPHQLGEVWASALWDMYWKFVEVYGFDEDIYNGTGGNNIAIQLVMDGMKLQSCDPGLLDGRNAIIVADALNNEGIHECLIWDVFAKRGLGWSADQGSAFNRNDGRSAFDGKPECIKELKITKLATEKINAGQEISYTITVTNHKDEAATDVVVTDKIPDGATYVAGSAMGTSVVSVSGTEVVFNVGTVASGESKSFSYRFSTANDLRSIRQFYDGMENGDGNWLVLNEAGDDIWVINNEGAYEGQAAWHAPSTVVENDQSLIIFQPITVSGTQPVLRFYHNYSTEPNTDAGLVQVSTNAVDWINVDQHIFKNNYRGEMAYTTFATANLPAYWGSSNGYVDTYIDLSAYQGQSIYVRFRYGSEAELTNPVPTPIGEGWFVDEIEFMDMFAYQSQACVTSAQGDLSCAEAPFRGTVVEPGATPSTDLENGAARVSVFPNPAKDRINVSFNAVSAQNILLEIVSADGRVMLTQTQRVGEGPQLLDLNVAHLATGMYFVRISAEQELAVEKILID